MTQTTSHHRLALLAAAIVGFATIGAGMAIMGPALPFYARKFQLDTAGTGFLVSAQWMGSFLGVAAMYRWSDRSTATPGLVLMAIGLTVMALAPGLALTVLGVVVFGLGYGTIATLFNPRVLSAFGRRGPAMLSLINAVFSAGAIAAPAGFVLAGNAPQPVLATLVVLAVLAAGLAWRAGMTGAAPARGAGPAGRPGFKLHLPILVLGLLAIGIEVSIAGLGPSALIGMGLAEEQAASLLAWFFVLALLTRLVLVPVAHRIPAFALFTLAVTWAAINSWGIIWLGPWLCFPAIGISAGLFFQGLYVTAAHKMGEDPRVPAIIMGNAQIGAILAPLVYARLMEAMGPGGLFVLLAVVSSGLSLASLALYRHMGR